MLGGGSAGGQLATMAALDGQVNDPGDDTTVSTRAVALVLFNPAYQTDDDPRLEPFGFSAGAFPPAIMFFGSADHWKNAGDSCYEELTRGGATVQLWVAPGQTHGFFNKKGWNESTCREAALFLHQRGLSAAPEDPVPASYALIRRAATKK